MKNKIIMLKGLPASGKTTWAISQCVDNANWLRTNKDDLREQHPVLNEKGIIKAETELVEEYLKNNINVVIDNTSFNSVHEKRYREFAEKYDYDFEIKYFDVDPITCIKRDALRGDKSVGEKVIREMYMRYVYKAPKSFTSIGKIIICDIDGTLAYKGDRDIFDYTKVSMDYVNNILVKILRMFIANGYKIVFLSGREELCKQETQDWIITHLRNYEFELFMRKTGDKRDDTIVKKEIFEEHFKITDIFCVFDDRPKVVQMWKEMGLYVFGCNQEPYNLNF